MAARFTVVMTFADDAERSQHTVHSLIANTKPDLYDVVIVDNATGPAGKVLLEALSGDVEVVTLSDRQSTGAARNAAVAKATGEIFVFLEAGAVLPPMWLDTISNLFAQSEQIGAVAADIETANGERVNAAQSFLQDRISSPATLSPVAAGVGDNDAAVALCAASPCLAARASSLKAVGGFDDSLSWPMVDADLTVRLTKSTLATIRQGQTRVGYPYALPKPANAELQRFTQTWSSQFQPDYVVTRPGESTSVYEDLSLLGEPAASALKQLSAALASGSTELGSLPHGAVESVRARLESEEEHRLLQVMRKGRDVCWVDDEDEPLVTCRIATYRQTETLKRAIASCLNQTYQRIEVLVVGDQCGPETVAAATSFDDPRVRFINLPARGIYPENKRALWQVGGVAPMNMGIELANGSWITATDDDDEFTPDHVEVLLNAARQNRLEMVWSKAEMEIGTAGNWEQIGSTPLQDGHITHGSVLYSLGLRFMKLNNAAWKLDRGADWNMWERMARIGVRCGFVDHVTYRHYLEGPYRDPMIASGQDG